MEESIYNEILELCATEDENDKLILPDEFDNCILGICYCLGDGFTPAYDLIKVLNILQKLGKCNETGAIRYFNEHIIDNYPLISFIKVKKESREELSKYNKNMLFLDGYSNEPIGVRFKSECQVVTAYDRDECISSLNEQMPYEDAVEYFEYNTMGSYVGNQNPVFITLLFSEYTN